MTMSYFDRLMYAYYRTLLNAHTSHIRSAAYQAIIWLTDLDAPARREQTIIDKVMAITSEELGPKFAAAVSNETYAYAERALRIGIQDTANQVRGKIAIGLYGVADAHLANTVASQNLFWIKNHFDSDISKDFRTVLTNSVQMGYTREQLAKALEKQFADLGPKSAHYWQGLAEHTALRIREFGRLSGYEKAGAQYYRLINPMDDRTSDICLALVSQGLIYPLQPALDLRERLMQIDESGGLESARDEIKALAPWIKESQIEYDNQGNPVGVSGTHTPFPPFHWKCRTQTEIVI